MGMLEKDLKKKKGQMLPFLKKKNKKTKTCNTSKNEDFLCYFQNSGIEQCCLVLFNLSLFCVNVDFMDYLKPVCFMLIIYIFSFI